MEKGSGNNFLERGAICEKQIRPLIGYSRLGIKQNTITPIPPLTGLVNVLISSILLI
jgi:hypothetical protein